MNFMTANYTDVGIKKKTNQDSMLVLQASTNAGNVLLAALCDGMGGLSKGELASATMIKLIAQWFSGKLPKLLESGFDRNQLWDQWAKLVNEGSDMIADYGAQIHVNLGTTAVALLIVGNSYYILNVGDSRVYLITDKCNQMTKDQTYVQREMDAGRMTPEQALNDPQRNVLLQCIGASRTVVPDFSFGTVQPNQVFMLCCDGFRHVISPDEFYQAFNANVLTSKEVMVENLKKMTKLNISRNEDDNISAILIKTL